MSNKDISDVKTPAFLIAEELQEKYELLLHHVELYLDKSLSVDALRAVVKELKK